MISFANQKGGVGKTTACINLAGALCEKGLRILLVDMDYQGNLSMGLGVRLGRDEKGMGEVMLFPDVSLGEVVRESPIPGADIAPGNFALSKVDINIDRLPDRHGILSGKLLEAKDNYDFVFMDCPPAFNLLTVNALSAADGVIIPLQCYPYSLAGLNTLLSIIDDVRYAYNFDLDVVGIAPTFYDTNTKLSEMVIDELRYNYPRKVFNTIIKKSVKVAEGPLHQKPMTLYAPRHPVTQAYRELAAEFLRRVS